MPLNVEAALRTLAPRVEGPARQIGQVMTAAAVGALTQAMIHGVACAIAWVPILNNGSTDPAPHDVSVIIEYARQPVKV